MSEPRAAQTRMCRNSFQTCSASRIARKASCSGCAHACVQACISKYVLTHTSPFPQPDAIARGAAWGQKELALLRRRPNYLGWAGRCDRAGDGIPSFALAMPLLPWASLAVRCICGVDATLPDCRIRRCEPVQRTRNNNTMAAKAAYSTERLTSRPSWNAMTKAARLTSSPTPPCALRASLYFRGGWGPTGLVPRLPQKRSPSRTRAGARAWVRGGIEKREKDGMK